MSTPKQIIRVSQETFDIVMNSNKHYYQLFSDWQGFGRTPLDKAMTELNHLYPDKYVSDVFDMLTRGEAVLFPKEQKKYRIIIDGISHSEAGAHWKYFYVALHEDGTPFIGKTDILDSVHEISENDLKNVPPLFQPYAKEVL